MTTTQTTWQKRETRRKLLLHP